MRNSWKTRSTLTTLTFLIMCVGAASLSAKNWNATNGNWNTAANWLPAAVPTAGEAVNIVFADGVARTITYDGPSVNLGLVTLDLTGPGTTTDTLSMPNNFSFFSSALLIGGYDGTTGLRTNGRGAVTQSNGLVQMNIGTDLALGNGVGSIGTYALSGSGAVVASQSIFVGYMGTGTFTQTGGTTTLQSSAVGTLNIAKFPNSTGTYNLSGGSVVSNVDEVVGDLGIGFFVQPGGTNTIQNSKNLYLGQNNGSAGTYTISNSATLTVANNLILGNAGTGAGTFNLQGNASVSVGNNLTISTTGAFNLSGGTLRFNAISGASRLNYTAGKISLPGARTLTSDPSITSIFGSTVTIPTGKALAVDGVATIADSFTGTTIVNGGELSASYYQIGAAAAGTLQVTGGGKVVNTAVSGTGLQIGGASATGTGSLVLSDPGTNVTVQTGVTVGLLGNGSLSISNGAVLNSSSAAVGSFASGVSGSVTITGAGSAWNLIDAPINIGAAGGGTVNVQDQGLLYIGTNLFMASAGTLNIDGGTVRFDTLNDANHPINFNSGILQLSSNRGVGADALITRFFGASPTMPAGKGLAVEGVATLTKTLSIAGGTFRAGGIVIGTNGALDFDRGTLELTGGGTIAGLTSLAIPTNGQFRAQGFQTMRIAGAAGSTITATGSLIIGDATAVNGFYTNGTVVVGSTIIQLADANDAVFDSGALISLGSGASGGTLNAANGLTLDFGANAIGFGPIITPNNAAKPLINNGHITGTSSTLRITLPGYVKGVGTFDNVNVTGTFSPGLSPSIVQTTNLSFGPGSSLVMEIGGTTAGSGYDQIQDAGQLSLGGTLQVALINGFTPVAGNSFDLLNWNSLVGTFSSLSLPTLTGGLTWNTSQLYTTGVLSIGGGGVPGDYNNNGVVDGADYVFLRKNNPSDYATWRSHFGQTAGSGAIITASTSAAIPEPTSAVLLLFAAAMCNGLVRNKR